jgi:hypothetical protein
VNKLIIAIGLLVLSTSLYAGVALDMVRTDTSGKETERSEILAQAGKLRINSGGGPFSSAVSMIFLGDKFLVIDHDKKSYIIMDEAMLDAVSSKISEAMKQMEAQLASMPPEQRAMAEQMMKSQMPGMMDEQEPTSMRVEAIGPGEWQGRACTRYAVFNGTEKSQDVCAAPLDQVDGAADMMEAFHGMAKFVKKLTESLPGPLAASISDNPGAVMEQIEGFPVHSVEYQYGQATAEVSLQSIEEQELGPSVFAAPDGYKLEEPLAGR